MASTSADPLVYEAPAWLKELDGGKSGINREDIKVRALSETYVVVEGDAGVADIFPELEAGLSGAFWSSASVATSA